MSLAMHTRVIIYGQTWRNGTRAAMTVLGVLLLGVTGCHSAGRIFYRPPSSHSATGGSPSYQLAADATTVPAATTRPAATQPAATQPADTRAMPFSAPRAEVRHAALAALLSEVPVSQDTLGAGRELAQTFTPGANGGRIAGRGGVSAPQPVAASAVNSRPGIVNTVLTLIPPADPSNNVLSARFNPATGPEGVCGRLQQLGFPASALSCTRRSAARHR